MTRVMRRTAILVATFAATSMTPTAFGDRGQDAGQAEAIVTAGLETIARQGWRSDEVGPSWMETARARELRRIIDELLDEADGRRSKVDAATCERRTA